MKWVDNKVALYGWVAMLDVPGGEFGVAGDALSAGKTVLGKYPAYKDMAQELGANWLNVPTDVWDAMSPAEQWAANQKFLDRAIARGDEFILATPVQDINEVSGSFRQELDYLTTKGYQLSADGTRMVK
jgi:hypothetical protein